MANIQLDSITSLSNGAWRFAWTGTGPYRVVLAGKLIATTSGTTFDWYRSGYPAYPPPIEVTEADDVAESERHPPFVTIQWSGVPGAAGYGIEQLISAQWVRVGSVHDTGKPVYTFQTANLEAGTVCSLRVNAEDVFGNAFASLAFTQTVVCNPPPPESSLAVSYAPGFVTIAEA